MKKELPSFELMEYVNNALDGNNPEIPLYGQGDELNIQICGTIDDGNEWAMFRIPWGTEKKFDKTYLINRTPAGEIEVTHSFLPHT